MYTLVQNLQLINKFSHKLINAESIGTHFLRFLDLSVPIGGQLGVQMLTHGEHMGTIVGPLCRILSKGLVSGNLD